MRLLSVARDLHRRRGRERTGLFLAEGVRTVEELLQSPLTIRGMIVSSALDGTPRGIALRQAIQQAAFDRQFTVLEVSDSELASTAATESPQGAVAVVEQPERSFERLKTEGMSRLLVLDGVQDPGNLGTILRTAHAFGLGATICLPGTADLWNAKVVRSAMGALFSHDAFHATPDRALEHCRTNGYTIWATSAVGEPIRNGEASAPARLAIVVGNEANGISGRLAEAADRTVAIPVRGVESLNVAVATGIILYAITA